MTAAVDQLIADARRMHRRAGSPRTASGAILPALFVMTDDVRTPDPGRLVAPLGSGCGFILRWRDDAERRTLASQLANRCAEQDVEFLIAGDAELAQSLHAGLHLSEHAAEHFQRPEWLSLLTAAAHSPQAVARAAAAGADAAIVSPVFSTPSHPGAATLGADGLRHMAALARIPVIAMGGISAGTVAAIADSGAAGVAGTGAFAAVGRGTKH